MSDILKHLSGWIDAIPETREDWLAKVTELKSLHRGAGWKLAYWVAWGLEQYPDLTVEDLAIQLNRDAQTIRNYKSIMRNPAADLAQRFGLSVSHAVEVQGLPDKEEWLRKATEGLWSCARLRAELRENRVATLAQAGQAPAPAPYAPSYAPVDDDEEPPFCHQEIAIDIPEPVKAFEIAEYIVTKWGQQMAREVVEELARWW